jgi:hypothetical protein
LSVEIVEAQQRRGRGTQLAGVVIQRARALEATTLGGAFVNPPALHIFEEHLGRPIRQCDIEDWEGGFPGDVAREADFSLAGQP